MHVYIVYKGLFSNENVTKYVFWVYFGYHETLTKFPIFDQNHGLTPLEKSKFSRFFKPTFSLFRRTSVVYKTSKIVFSPFIVAIYDMGIQGVTRGHKALQGVTRGDSGWQGVTVVTKDYTNFLLTKTFPDTFPWSILHKNQSWRNFKFLTKTMD